jgi:hypothetical protein
MDVIVFVVVIALLGLIPAAIARNKGRSFGAWWLYGALLFIIALPHALLLKSDRAAIERRQVAEGYRKCRFCAEMVKADAIVCRYCGRDLVDRAGKYPFCGAQLHGAVKKCPTCHEEWA